ncbi:MAG: TonB-dependent receptor [Rhodothermales bacterium]
MLDAVRSASPTVVVISTARRTVRKSFLPLLFVLAGTTVALGQGKLAGRVQDSRTGEPLIGVNVFVDETQQGTVTDVDGNYILLNLRPSEYTIRYSYIGYETRRVEGIRIVTDQTTRYDVQLSEETIEGQEVVIQAERPLIQRDLTASKKTVLADEIAALPVEDFFGVLQTQAGVTKDADGATHIRGGRSNEISYMVDGLSVGNPFTTNGLATEVATNAIEELTVVSGAFNAEYGQAMSGIVNIVTREGGSKIDGSLSVTAGDRITSHDALWGIPNGIKPRTSTLQGSFGGPLPISNNLRFFASGRYDHSDGYIFGYREHLPSDSANFNTGYYEIQGKPWWEYKPIGELDVPHDPVSMNDRDDYSFTGKVTYRLKPQMKLEYTYLRDGTRRTQFDFDYRYDPDGLATIREKSENHGIHWTHTLNDRTFYTVRLSFASNNYDEYVYKDPTDPRYVKDQGDAGTGNVVGFPGSNFLFGGNKKAHVEETASSMRGKVDFTHQFGSVHETKVGVDWGIHSLSRENYVILYDGNRYLAPTVPAISSPDHDKYTDQGILQVSAYAQDKLEFEDFIINAGIRFDRFNADGFYIPDLRDPWQDRLERTVKKADANPKNRVSPRLGVSFPITATGIIHFSYGHFYQMPTPRQMFINPEFEFGVGNIPEFGNSNLRPEKTVLYEFGLQQQLGNTLAFDVTGFFKDIRDYLARQRVRFSTIPGEDSYRMWRNLDYANVKGITFSLTKRREPGGLLSATVDYSFLVAEGNNNDTDSFFFNFLSGREDELELVPLDFDQRHVISTTVSLSHPQSWGISFIGQYSTGYPYSPLIFDQNVDLLPNSDRKPSQLDIDARLFKNVRIGSVQLQLFAKAFNLLDRKNERFVFDDTGRADRTLNISNVHASWEPAYGLPGIHTLDEWNTRPHWFTAPREIRIGASLTL